MIILNEEWEVVLNSIVPTPIRQRIHRMLFLLGMAILAAGCSSSDPLPLTRQAIDAALTPPEMEALRVQAQSIQHPLLRPLEIEGRDGLKPDEVAILAVLVNPSLRAVRDARGIASAQVLQAGLLPNPSLSWSSEHPYAGPDNINAFGLGLSWDLSELISRSAKVEAAEALAASVDLDIAWEEWQVAQSAKSAAYAVTSLQAQLVLTRQADQSLQDNLRIIQKAVDLQQKTAVDLSAAQTAGQEAHSAVLEAERQLDQKRLALNRLMGVPFSTEVKLKSAGIPDRMEVRSPAELQTGLEDRRLDLLALRRGYDSQEASVRVAILSRFPKTSAGLLMARDTGGVSTFGYELSADLPLFDRNQGSIALEKATRQQLFDEFINRVFEARNDIAVSVAEIESLNYQIAFAESAVPVLERLVADYEKAVNVGNADVLSYYTARNDLDKKKIEIVKLKQERIDGWIALENATGMYLPAVSADGSNHSVLPDGSQGVLQ